MFGTRSLSRARYLTLTVFLVAVVAIDTVLWAVACGRIDDGARKAAAAAGWTLSAGPTRWSGWPIAAEVGLPDAVLRAGPDIIPPLTWTAPHAALRLTAWHPTLLTASAIGRQTLAIGVAAPVPFTAETLHATIDLTAHDPVRVAATTLDIAAPDGSVRIAAAELLLLPDGLSADISGMTLPGRGGQPIAPPVDALRFDARLTPPIVPQPTAIDSARIWRSTGGKLDLDSMSLRWGPLEATGRAVLTLDAELQPAITGQLTATGLASVIERLAQTGAMTRSAATAAQAMLTILSVPSGGGPLTLPVTVQDGVVTVARIPLLRLAPLQWD